jgi:hypothetical protein
MRTTLVKFAGVVAVAALIVAPVFAGPSSGKYLTRNETLVNPEKIAGQQLAPGQYIFHLEGDKLVIEHQENRKLVMEVPGSWQPGTAKADHDELRDGADGQVHEILFEGQTGSFIVGGK